MRYKKFLALILAAITAMGLAATVSADTIEELEAQKAETESNLSSVNSYIDTLEADKAVLLSQMDSVDQELVVTIQTVNSLNADIEELNVQLEQTTADLAVAEEDQAVQYEAMKKRIQYIYEEGGNAGWATFLLADADITELLNKAEYTQQMYDYDRECLEEYAATVERVNNLKTQQEQQQAELVAMRNEQEQYQQSLEIQLEELRATSDDYEAELANAQALANEYGALIAQQNEQIQIVQEELARQAAEEAARRAAEAAAAAQAAADAEAAAEAQRAAEEAAQAAEEGDVQGAQDAADAAEEAAGSSGGSSSGGSSSAPSVDTSTPSSPGNSALGAQIVAYAKQFVGNPYVYGGNSLTNGIDCSGFTQQIYGHFGISLPRTSGSQRSAGRAVSYAEAQPGDLICYSGHVAIYIGGGAIVHAANESLGITIGYNAAYREILSVRRFV
ncbi:MAG TPA: C40 family peptidase [Candidatus Alectryocaccobium stercorigallinarum]|nr:C40 family peptidase [Candidatus Alectryocaccobium stercorigallinarum]